MSAVYVPTPIFFILHPTVPTPVLRHWVPRSPSVEPWFPWARTCQVCSEALSCNPGAGSRHSYSVVTSEGCFPLSCHLRGSGGWELELWSQKVWFEILDLPLTSITLGKVIKSWWPGFLLYVMEIIIACTSYGYCVNAMSCICRMQRNIASTK